MSSFVGRLGLWVEDFTRGRGLPHGRESAANPINRWDVRPLPTNKQTPTMGPSTMPWCRLHAGWVRPQLPGFHPGALLLHRQRCHSGCYAVACGWLGSRCVSVVIIGYVVYPEYQVEVHPPTHSSLQRQWCALSGIPQCEEPTNCFKKAVQELLFTFIPRGPETVFAHPLCTLFCIIEPLFAHWCRGAVLVSSLRFGTEVYCYQIFSSDSERGFPHCNLCTAATMFFAPKPCSLLCNWSGCPVPFPALPLSLELPGLGWYRALFCPAFLRGHPFCL